MKDIKVTKKILADIVVITVHIPRTVYNDISAGIDICELVRNTLSDFCRKGIWVAVHCLHRCSRRHCISI